MGAAGYERRSTSRPATRPRLAGTTGARQTADTKVVQEQQQRVHDQQTTIADLQARFARLESLLPIATGAGGR